MKTSHDEDLRREVAAVLAGRREIALAASIGGHARVNLVPFAFSEDDLTFYSFVRKGPPAMQLHHHPRVSLLATSAGEGGSTREVEVTGVALLLQDEADRSKARGLLGERNMCVLLLSR